MNRNYDTYSFSMDDRDYLLETYRLKEVFKKRKRKKWIMTICFLSIISLLSFIFILDFKVDDIGDFLCILLVSLIETILYATVSMIVFHPIIKEDILQKTYLANRESNNSLANEYENEELNLKLLITNLRDEIDSLKKENQVIKSALEKYEK